MHIALIYGRFCSGGPGAFDVQNLYRNKGLTGSESYFFNTARGLAERGHKIQVFCDCTQEIDRAAPLGGASVRKLENIQDWNPENRVCFSWNEPDIFRVTPPGPLRILVQQLNDWNYCGAGFDAFVDLYAFPSEWHRRFMIGQGRLDPEKTIVASNSINLEFYKGTEQRRHHSVAYCSSPDRGLHWLLEYWPHVRKRVPDAELRVYYKVQSWLDGSRPLWYDRGMNCWWEGGFRARYVEECLERLGRSGENGVYLVGPVPNEDMARELMRTEVLAYPCDTLRPTEGFSVTIMDAIAAGCRVIISDADAIGEVYRDVAAQIIPGRPRSRDERWIDAIVRALTEPKPIIIRSDFLERFRRENRAAEWEALLVEHMARAKGKAA